MAYTMPSVTPLYKTSLMLGDKVHAICMYRGYPYRVLQVVICLEIHACMQKSLHCWRNHLFSEHEVFKVLDMVRKSPWISLLITN
jgi:hypothetical protein